MHAPQLIPRVHWGSIVTKSQHRCLSLTGGKCRALRTYKAWATSLPRDELLLATASQADMDALPLFRHPELEREAQLRAEMMASAEQVPM